MHTAQAKTSLAKITRPKLSDIAPRERLFRLLDKGRATAVTWVAAEAGSGKTTLVASYLDSRRLPCIWYQVDAGDGDIASFFYYLGLAARKAAPRHKKPLPLLTPEYLMGIPVFSRRYFEELFHRLKPSFAIVLDNYQDVPPDSGFHDMLLNGLDVVPEGITVLVLSRIDPPLQFARLRANRRLQQIGWDDIRFTREESRELLETQGMGKPTKKAVDLLHEKTEGWAAGIMLLLAGNAEPDSFSSGRVSSAGLFDYFANEIFTKAEAATQDVLLKTSFLRRIDPLDAEQLTENRMAGHILARLSRQHYFTQKYDRAYQYHPLFREFLQGRAKNTLFEEDIVRIRRNAAQILERSGRFEEAIGLYLESSDWGKAERLIHFQALQLVSQGRSATLSGWLKSFPQERREQAPWLLYWSGICSLLFDPREARAWLEKAFELFKSQNDPPGLFLSWASIIDTFIYEWGTFSPLDHWIAVMEELLAKQPAFPSPEIEVRVTIGMFNALMWRQPHDPALPLWADRALMFTLHTDNTQMRLMLGNTIIVYYLWIGEASKAAMIVNALKAAGSQPDNDPLAQLHWWVMYSMYSWFCADHETCLHAVREGLRLAERTNVHLLDFFLIGQGIYSCNSTADHDTASELLEKMSSLRSPLMMDIISRHYQTAITAWFRGDLQKALHHGGLAIQFADRTESPFPRALCHAEHGITAFDAGDSKASLLHLDKAEELGRGMRRIEYMCSLARARIAFAEERQEDGLAYLRRSFGIGAQQGYVNFTRWRPDIMSDLCARALAHDIEPDYVQNLIRKRNLTAPSFDALFRAREQDVTVLDAWPYLVRIITLGRFEILKHGEKLVFGAKTPRKPLELLKALVSFGGEQVPEEKFHEALWPDAEGDQAHRAFETTLYRLRQLIGDGALRLQGGLLSLDKGNCWTDAWVFERCTDEAGKLSEQERARLREHAFALYKGNFLPYDTGQPWSVSLREGLRSRFARLIVTLGIDQEGLGNWDLALQYFQKGLEIDDLAEEFYQHLMLCQIKLGRHAQAAAAYQRCRRALHHAFGILPSRRTEEIHASLMSES